MKPCRDRADLLAFRDIQKCQRFSLFGIGLSELGTTEEKDGSIPRMKLNVSTKKSH